MIHEIIYKCIYKRIDHFTSQVSYNTIVSSFVLLLILYFTEQNIDDVPNVLESNTLYQRVLEGSHRKHPNYGLNRTK